MQQTTEYSYEYVSLDDGHLPTAGQLYMFKPYGGGNAVLGKMNANNTMTVSATGEIKSLTHFCKFKRLA